MFKKEIKMKIPTKFITAHIYLLNKWVFPQTINKIKTSERTLADFINVNIGLETYTNT